MTSPEVADQIIDVLLVFTEMALLDSVHREVENHFKRPLAATRFQSLLDAVDHLEKTKKQYGLIVFEHKSTSMTILRAFLEVGGNAAYILCGPDGTLLQGIDGSDTPIEFIHVGSILQELGKTINRLEVTGRIPLMRREESEYIVIRPDYLPSMGPLEATVYAQLIEGHYVPVFNKGDLVERTEVEKFLESKKLTHFYFRREDCTKMLGNRQEELERALSKDPIDEKATAKAIELGHGMVRDVVNSMGFTPEAQKVAVTSVSATIKLMGSKPKLSTILVDLKNKEGNYLTAHSLMLGKAACALAYKIGWTSNTTYFKLTLAAFLHDLALNDDRLAVVFSLDKASESGSFTPEELKEIRMHSNKAADHARSMSEVPSDVEQIVAQHHERPDGTGFPRGLNAKFITPLSALFIIAQDLIEYSQNFKSKEVDLTSYFDAREAYFNAGVFRKIFHALKNDLKIL
jgi:HD-GYP domain-containing protein (c-di-GMP phosphodiesterase class II)